MSRTSACRERRPPYADAVAVHEPAHLLGRAALVERASGAREASGRLRPSRRRPRTRSAGAAPVPSPLPSSRRRTRRRARGVRALRRRARASDAMFCSNVEVKPTTSYVLPTAPWPGSARGTARRLPRMREQPRRSRPRPGASPGAGCASTYAMSARRPRAVERLGEQPVACERGVRQLVRDPAVLVDADRVREGEVRGSGCRTRCPPRWSRAFSRLIPSAGRSRRPEGMLTSTTRAT